MTPIPNRLYFRIGEVSRLVGVAAYVLRFWEKELPSVAPGRVNGQRSYRRQDVERLCEIKRLRYTDGYSIAGARRALELKAQVS